MHPHTVQCLDLLASRALKAMPSKAYSYSSAPYTPRILADVKLQTHAGVCPDKVCDLQLPLVQGHTAVPKVFVHGGRKGVNPTDTITLSTLANPDAHLYNRHFSPR